MTSPAPVNTDGPGVELLFPHKPTVNRGLTRVVLRPGHVDADTREFFTAGNCHMLAGAMHELTGWSLIALYRVRDDHWLHVGVQMPDGRFLDINGPQPVDAMRSQLSAQQHEPVRSQALGSLRAFARGIGVRPGWTWRVETDQASADAIVAMAAALLESVRTNSPARPAKSPRDADARRTPTRGATPSSGADAAGLTPHIAALEAAARHLGDVNAMLQRVQAQMTQHGMGSEATGALGTARDANVAAAEAMLRAAQVTERVNRKVQEAYNASRGQAASKEYQQTGQ